MQLAKSIPAVFLVLTLSCMPVPHSALERGMRYGAHRGTRGQQSVQDDEFKSMSLMFKESSTVTFRDPADVCSRFSEVGCASAKSGQVRVDYDTYVPKEVQKTMTHEVCWNFCRTVSGSWGFGLEKGSTCFCSPFVEAADGTAACDSACAGNSSQMCGGGSSTSMFKMHDCDPGAIECFMPPPDVANAIMFNSSAYGDFTPCKNYMRAVGDTRQNKVCELECEPGFENLHNSIECTGKSSRHGHRWGLFTGWAACNPRSCGLPPCVKHSRYSTAEVLFPFFAQYTCQLGYSVGGNFDDSISFQVNCTTDGNFTPALECLPIKCGLPPADASATLITNYTSQTFGMSSKYMCKEGYSLTQAATGAKTYRRVCEHTGNFSDGQECKAISCGPPPTYKNATLKEASSDAVTYTQTLIYGCNEGFSTDGRPAAQADKNDFFNSSCTKDGFFSAALTLCMRVSCGMPPRVNHSTMIPHEAFVFFEDVVSYKCEVGYTTDGIAKGEKEFKLTCGPDGKFTSEPKACKPVTCGDAPTLPNASVVGSSGPHHFPDSVPYKCAPGYSIRANDDPSNMSSATFSVACLSDGQFARAPVCINVNNCEQPFVKHCSFHGTCVDHAIPTGNADEDWHCDCESGYESISIPPQGTSPRGENCSNINDCPPTGSYAYGCGGADIGHCVDLINEYTCECAEGYEEMELKTSEKNTTCIPMTCNSIPNVSFANYTVPPGLPETLKDFLDNTKALYKASDLLFSSPAVVYQCMEGFTLTGVAGEVSSFKVNCTAVDAGVELSPSPRPVCKPVSCGDPPQVENANIVHPLGDIGEVFYAEELIDRTIKYACELGYTNDTQGKYVANASFEIECLPSGKTTSPQRCVPVQCGSPPPLKGAVDLPQQSSSYLQTVEYACEEGHSTDASYNPESFQFSSTCQFDGKFEAEFDGCEPIECGTAPEVDNAKADSDSILVFRNIANYTTVKGYSIDGKADGPKTFGIKCLASSKFEEKAELLPVKPVKCGRPAKVKNARVDRKPRVFKDVVNYTCVLGYSVDGSPVQHAQDTNAGFKTACQDDGTFADITESCKPVVCKASQLPNDKLSYTTLVNDTATAVFTFLDPAHFKCKPGYSLNGLLSGSLDFELPCLASGSFADPQYKCLNIDDCPGSICGQDGHGVCFDKPVPVGPHFDNYECHCDSGFLPDVLDEGPVKQRYCKNINDCPKDACSPGGCKDLINKYSCNCPSGYFAGPVGYEYKVPTAPATRSAGSHMAVLGRPTVRNNHRGECLWNYATKFEGSTAGWSFKMDKTKRLGTSCCKDNAPGSRSGCKSGLTFPEAEAYCQSLGMRLCTAKEMRAHKTSYKGCSFDGTLNWVSDPCQAKTTNILEGYNKLDGDCYGANLKVLENTDLTACLQACSADPACTGSSFGMGNRCVLKNHGCTHTVQDGWTYYAKATTATSYWAVSGSYKGHKTGHRGSFTDVKCLSESSTTGLGKEVGTVCCDSTGKGSRPNCKKGDYSTAAAHCASKGMTLCSSEQLKNGAGEASGCGFDALLVWSSTPCSEVSGAAMLQRRAMKAANESCQKQYCYPPGGKEFFAKDVSTLIKFEDTVTYKCLDGYSLNGEFGGSTKFDVKCMAGVAASELGKLTAITSECKPVSCGKPPAKDNAKRSTVLKVVYGQSVQYTCQTGYSTDASCGEPSKAFSMKCGADGKLSFVEESKTSCKPVKAGKPLVPFATYKTDDMYFPSKVKVTCDEGYSVGHRPDGGLRTTFKLKALANCSIGANIPQPFVCVINECGVPKDVLHASVNTSEVIYYNQGVLYTAKTGYTVDGTANGQKEISMSCQADASFSTIDDKLPLKPVSCGAPEELPHATVPAGVLTYAQNATYTCEYGYTLDKKIAGYSNSVFAVYCHANGTLEPKLRIDGVSSCKPVECGAPPTLAHAIHAEGLSEMIVAFPDVVAYKCEPGWSLDGALDGPTSFNVSCQAHGQFKTAPYECKNMDDCEGNRCGANGDCKDKSNPTGVHLNDYQCDCHSGFETKVEEENGTSYHVCGNIPDCPLEACHPGSCQDLVNDYACKCPEGYKIGKNEAEGLKHDCLPLSCGTPPTHANATFTGGDRVYLEKVKYTCKEGYTLDGSPHGTSTFEITCGLTSTDKTVGYTALDTCQLITCGATAPLSFASMNATKLLFSEAVTYTCDEGYSTNGDCDSTSKPSFLMHCVSNGSIVNADGSTAPKQCLPVSAGSPDEADLPFATFSKEEMFYPDSTSVTCKLGFSTDPENPANPSKKTFQLYAATDCAFEDHPICQNVSCGMPPRVDYAEIPQSTKVVFPNFVKYTAVTGYTLDGNADGEKSFKVTCSADGTFMGQDVELKPVRCGTPKDLANAEHSDEEATFGQTVKYTCLDGFSTDGKAPVLQIGANNLEFDVKCQATGKFTDPTESCVPVVCGQAPAQPHAKIGDNKSFVVGDSGTFTCLPGYSLSGVLNAGDISFEVVCVSFGQWLTTGVCQNNNDCQEETCGGHGKCEDLPEPTGIHIKDFVCKCDSGYEEKVGNATRVCENINDCPANACQPGTCVDLINAYSCQCPNGYHNKSSTSTNSSCKVQTCKVPEMPHTSLGSSDAGEPISFNAPREYQCESGYSLDGAPADAPKFNLTCSGNNMNTPEGFIMSIPVCIPVSCGEVEAIPDAVASTTSLYYNQEVVFACNRGHSTRGLCAAGSKAYFKGKCEANGSIVYDPTHSSCEANLAGTPTAEMLPNAEFAPNRAMSYGMSMKVKCLPGYSTDPFQFQAKQAQSGCVTQSGEACVFPFKYRGILYDACTKANNPRFWCATKTNAKGNYIGQWGDCAATCPKTGELQCPPGTQQVGPMNADVGGCGITGCNARYSVKTIEECSAKCQSNSRCKSFNWAPMNGDRNHKNVRVCTMYDRATQTGTWSPSQILCKPEICETAGNAGNGAGLRCVFPFKYKGITYDGCTKANAPRLWCATKTDPSGNYIGQWGDCSSACPKASTFKPRVSSFLLKTTPDCGFEEVPKCKPISCGIPPKVPMASSSNKTDVFFGGAAAYTCAEGYTITGKAGAEVSFQIRCMTSGKFSRPKKCKPVQCGAAVSLPFSSIFKGLKYGTKGGRKPKVIVNPPMPATCKCMHCGGGQGPWQSGFCVAGGTSVGQQCKSDSQMSGCYSSLDDYGCYCPGTVGPQFEAMGGMIFTYRDQVVYECLDGYSLTPSLPWKSEPFTLSCEKNGQFSGMKKCAPKVCTLANRTLSTLLTKSAVYKDPVTYKCHYGYSVTGTPPNSAGDLVYQETCKSDTNISETAHCKDINYCLEENYCGPGGACIDGLSDYTCDCSKGYEVAEPDEYQRPYCVEVDECIEWDGNSHCGAHGTCKNGLAEFTCLCEVGYEAKPIQGDLKGERCTGKVCGFPPEIEHATDQSDVSKVAFPMKVPYRCDDGYTMNGTLIGDTLFKMACQPDKSFAAFAESSNYTEQVAMPACMPIACPPALPIVDHATVEGGPLFFELNEATYTCEPGYTTSGVADGPTSFEVTCNHIGEFTETAECQPVSCGAPPSVDHASFDSADRVLKESTNYTCEEGYTTDAIAGGCNNFSITCQASGNFTKVGACSPVQCLFPPFFENANYQTDAKVYGEEFQVMCKAGYKTAEGKGSFIVKCLKTGKYDDTNSCLPISCGKPSNTSHASPTAPDVEVVYTESAEFQCDEGYSVNGLPTGETVFTRTCDANGKFMQASPSYCKDINYCYDLPCGLHGACYDCSMNPKDCLVQPKPSKVYSKYGGKYLKKSRPRKYKTKRGASFLHEDSAAIFKSNGKYSCLCAKGYEITEDDGNMQCSEDDCNNNACGKGGSCIDLSDQGVEDSYSCICKTGYFLTTFMLGDTEMPTCDIVRCSDSGPPKHKYSTATHLSYRYRGRAPKGDLLVRAFDSIRYVCDKGYSTDGSTAPENRKYTMQCDATGLFFNVQECRAIECDAEQLPDVPHANMSNSQNKDFYVYGENVEYTCAAGYYLEGGSTRSAQGSDLGTSVDALPWGIGANTFSIGCQANGRFTRPQKCRPKSCGRPKKFRKAYSSRAVVYYPNAVTYHCAYGHYTDAQKATFVVRCGADGNFTEKDYENCYPAQCSENFFVGQSRRVNCPLYMTLNGRTSGRTFYEEKCTAGGKIKRSHGGATCQPVSYRVVGMVTDAADAWMKLQDATIEITKSPISEKSCKELGWIDNKQSVRSLKSKYRKPSRTSRQRSRTSGKYRRTNEPSVGVPGICAMKQSKCSMGSTDVKTAKQYCEGMGARLCSHLEIIKGVSCKRERGCNLDEKPVWTNTPCQGGGFYAVRCQDKSAQCITDGSAYGGRCCANINTKLESSWTTKTVYAGYSGEYLAQLYAAEYRVKASAAGYISDIKELLVRSDIQSDPGPADMSLSREMPPGEWRIVLSWDRKSRDLDSWLIFGTKTKCDSNSCSGACEAGWYNTHEECPYDSINVEATLERDFTYGFGPETMNIKGVGNCVKTRRQDCVIIFQTINYTPESKDLSKSGAKVAVYSGNERRMMIEVPANIGDATMFPILTIDASNGKLYKGDKSAFLAATNPAKKRKRRTFRRRSRWSRSRYHRRRGY